MSGKIPGKVLKINDNMVKLKEHDYIIVYQIQFMPFENEFRPWE